MDRAEYYKDELQKANNEIDKANKEVEQLKTDMDSILDTNIFNEINGGNE